MTVLKFILGIVVFALLIEAAALTRGGIGPILTQVVSR